MKTLNIIGALVAVLMMASACRGLPPPPIVQVHNTTNLNIVVFSSVVAAGNSEEIWLPESGDFFEAGFVLKLAPGESDTYVDTFIPTSDRVAEGRWIVFSALTPEPEKQLVFQHITTKQALEEAEWNFTIRDMRDELEHRLSRQAQD